MKQKIKHFTITVLTLLFFLPCAGYSAGEISFISNFGGSARHSAIEGDYMYSLIGDRLFVADISDMQNPVELSAVALPDRARRLVIANDVAFIACSRGGLVAVDVSNPSNPVLLDSITFDSSKEICQTFGIAVRDDLAYVADYTGMHVVDISSPSAMSLESSYTDFDSDKHHAYDVYLNGDYAYISCEVDGLYIVNISNPLTPVRVSSFKDSAKELGQFYQSMRYGDFLLIAGGKAGLVVLDVSDITQPVYVSNIDNDYQGVLAFVKKGDNVYICTEFTDFYSIDISDIYNPEQVEDFYLDGHHSLGIAIKDDTIMLANSNYGIRLFDVSDSTIEQIGAFESTGRVIDCQAVGNHAYVAAGHNGLQVIDLTDPAMPKTVAAVKTEAYANGLFVNGSHVYVAELDYKAGSGGFLEIFDISNPSAPVYSGKVSLNGEPYDVVVENSTAYVTCLTKGVTLVNVSNPASPLIIAEFNTKGIAYKPTLWGNILLLADGMDGLVAIDVKDKIYPKHIQTLHNIGNVQDISLWSTYAFLPAASDGLYAVDISKPYLPEILKEIDVSEERGDKGQFKAVEAFDNYLLVADKLGVRLFDIKSADNMEEIDYLHRFLGDPVKITYDKTTGRAYVSSQISGLYIFDISVQATAESQVEGRWIGSGTKDGMPIGIVLPLMQSHTDIFSSVLLINDREQVGIFSGDVSGSTITGDVSLDGMTARAELFYDPSLGTLTGSIEGDFTVSDIYLEYSGIVGHNDMLSSLMSLSSAVDERLSETDNFLEKLLLPVAQPFLTASMSEKLLSRELFNLSPAETLIAFTGRRGSLAAADNHVLNSAIWETNILKAVSDSCREDICEDYRFWLDLPGSIGDTALDLALNRNNIFLTPESLFYFSVASSNYESVIDGFKTYKPLCPGFGIEKFSGYYEGTIDFLGIISGNLYACVDEDDAGNVTGDFFIALEASKEYMNGTLEDGFNSTDTGESVVTGTILVPFGEITAHIIIEGLQYNLSTGKWAGQVEVQEQKVTGNVTLTWVSDQCPEDWNVR